ncbi:MAG TPA: dethiobiotin synthase [Verrucomicrobiae bacterium]|jgi:dethiobiotin synthetase|nr:dethiobiotin synthase [Verrucomicrobiae bacterium]
MKRKIFFVTGTDTGVGKTVLTVLLVKFLCVRDFNVAGIKPICSGVRDDAQKIFLAMNGALSLDEINPWHFRAPIAPLLAAQRENEKVKLPQILAHIFSTRKRFEILLVEGAGGLLSPLGENFNSRDLILALRATPIIVAQNKLGAVNQILLTLEALPKNLRNKTRVVLMSPRKLDAATKSNAKLLARFFAGKRIFTLPWLGGNFSMPEALKNSRVRRTLRALADQ